MRKYILIISLLLIAILFSTYILNQKETKESIKLGGLFILTGPGSTIGQEELKGAELAVQEINNEGGINGQQIELVVENASFLEPNKTLSAVLKLITNDQVIAIVGPTWDELAQTILPTIESQKIPTIGPDQTHDLEKEKTYDYFYSMWYEDEIGIRSLLAFAQDQGWERVAILRPSDTGFFQYTRNLFLDNAEEYGIQVTDDINIGNPITADYRTYILKAENNNPDAIFIALGDFSVCSFTKQIIELGVDTPVLSTEGAGNNISLNECPKSMEQLYFYYPRDTLRREEFMLSFAKMHERTPNFSSAANAYDAVRVIAEGLRQSNGNGGEELRTTINQINSFPGTAFEAINFDEKGFVSTPEDTFEIFTVRNGEFTKAKQRD